MEESGLDLDKSDPRVSSRHNVMIIITKLPGTVSRAEMADDKEVRYLGWADSSRYLDIMNLN